MSLSSAVPSSTTYSIMDNDHYSQYVANTRYIEIHLHIKPCGSSLATLYFTDEDNNIIDIPKRIVVYTYDYNTHERIVLKPLPNKPRYCLCHTDDYEIEYYTEKILVLKPQKGWKIIGAKV